MDDSELTSEDLRKVASLLEGNQVKRSDISFGTYSTRISRAYNLWASIEAETDVFKVVRREVDNARKETKWPANVKFTLSNVHMHSHLAGLFTNFTSSDDKTTLFQKVLEVYVRSRFPEEFGHEKNFKKTPVGKKIEEEIMRRAIETVAPGKVGLKRSKSASRQVSASNLMRGRAASGSRPVSNDSSYSFSESRSVSRDTSYAQNGTNPASRDTPTSKRGSNLARRGGARSLFPEHGGRLVSLGTQFADMVFLGNDGEDDNQGTPGSKILDTNEPELVSVPRVEPKNLNLKRSRVSSFATPTIDGEELQQEAKRIRKSFTPPSPTTPTIQAHFKTPDILIINGDEYKRGDKESAYNSGWARLDNRKNVILGDEDDSLFSRVRYAFKVGNKARGSKVTVDGVEIPLYKPVGNKVQGIISQRTFTVEGVHYMEYEMLIETGKLQLDGL